MKNITKSVIVLLIAVSLLGVFTSRFIPTASAVSSYTVVPSAYGTIGGTATFLGPLANAQRTYQFLIRDTLLSGLVGQQITGISLRLNTGAVNPWPAANVSFSNFDLYLSGSVTPALRSLTFANNIVGVQKQVRSGPLSVTAGAYTTGGPPHPWGPEITFDSAYLYTGGHLLIELRQNGHNGTSQSNDALSTSTPGYGTDFSACWTSSYTGTTGSQGNFIIHRLTHDGPVGIGNNTGVVKEFTLKQNYPNPFNPNTKIEFALPKNSFVKLAIYDALGREVSTLVNKHMNSGQYEVDWNADKFTSGIYYYKLTSGDFTETKKMMLVK